MSLKSSYKLQGYLVRQIEEMFEEDAIEPANRLTAKIGARMARGNFRAQTKNTGTGETLRVIKAEKGKYDDTTWIYGVLGDPGAKWTETTGARAHFFEYGRSAPGFGKDSSGKAMPVSMRPQPPRPFMRPTVSTLQRRLKGNTSKQVKRLVRKINKGKTPKNIISQHVDK